MADQLGSDQKQLEANLALLELDGVDVDVLRNMIVGTPSREGELGVEDGSQTGDFSGMSFVSNGSEVPVAGGKADVSGISGEISLQGYQYGSAIPDGEGFEHNDLTGEYGGDTSPYSIQDSTVFDGAWALEASSNATWDIIVRDSADEFDLNDIRIDFQAQFPSSGAGGGLGVFTSVSGASNASGYSVYGDPSGTNPMAIFDHSSGSHTRLEEGGSSPSTGSWVSGRVDFLADDTIEFTLDGTTISVVDGTYQSVRLGFACYNQAYIDDIQFSQI